MKLPLKIGIPLLILLWLAGGYTPYGQGKTLMVVLAIGVALWTAFSLPHPGPKERPPPEDDEDDTIHWEGPPPLEEEEEQEKPPEGDPPTNGSGRHKN